MKVKLNDKYHDIEEGTTLSAFLESLGHSPQGMALAIDYEVIPKEQWETTILTENVEMMLIHAVSGG